MFKLTLYFALCVCMAYLGLVRDGLTSAMLTFIYVALVIGFFEFCKFARDYLMRTLKKPVRIKGVVTRTYTEKKLSNGAYIGPRSSAVRFHNVYFSCVELRCDDQVRRVYMEWVNELDEDFKLQFKPGDLVDIIARKYNAKTYMTDELFYKYFGITSL